MSSPIGHRGESGYDKSEIDSSLNNHLSSVATQAWSWPEQTLEGHNHELSPDLSLMLSAWPETTKILGQTLQFPRSAMSIESRNLQVFRLSCTPSSSLTWELIYYREPTTPTCKSPPAPRRNVSPTPFSTAQPTSPGPVT